MSKQQITNVKQVEAFAGPGKRRVDKCLYLTATSRERKSWLFIYKSPVTGKPREMGLGYAGPAGVTLAEAREKAHALRKVLQDDKDPLIERAAEEERQRKAARVVPTFGDYADDYIAKNEHAWKNVKHRDQWKATLTKHAAHLRPLKVDAIDTADVMAVLEPIWDATRETARRLRSRIEMVLDAARVDGHREGENPARFADHLKHKLSKKKQVRGRHASLHWKELPEFMVKLRAREEIGARLLEFSILTVARSGEARGVTWQEINPLLRKWTVPPERMKAGKEHEVPLVPRALEIIEAMRPLKMEGSDLVFPNREGKPFSDASMGKTLEAMGYGHVTQHGFRATMSTWRAAATEFVDELAEMALAHAIPDKVKEAYQRDKMYMRRVPFMKAWSDQCDGTWVNPHAAEDDDNVIPFQAQA